ncbi:Reverse gyrase [Candidatus Gugararchaeum adminiculabundum]|nr:Reverse gyrase [Candidatus Gugararchaeum adminiculabundum]
MKLIVCEKPSVASRVAQALSQGVNGAKKSGKITYFEIERDGEKMLIAPAVGHLYTIVQTAKQKGYPVFDVTWGPSHKSSKEAAFTKPYLDNLTKLGKKKGITEYINSCDFDLEGSVIGYNAIRFACGNTDESKIKRMKFSALTDEDLVEAYDNRMPLDKTNVEAGEARHMLDWLWGINLSRALMQAIKTSGSFRIMSIGRVQGPSLNILVKKEKSIAEFISEPYWELYASCKGVKFQHETRRFKAKEDADEAKDKSSKNSTVSKVERRVFATPSPFPFDLTTLQVDSYAAFGYSPSRTLEIAQTLYEGTLISYPRTASQKLPERLNLQKIIKEIAKNPEYAHLANELIHDRLFKPNEGKKEDAAHPAIFPTGKIPAKSLGAQEKKLYDLITKRFLACFATPAKREELKVALLSGTEKYTLSGRRTIEENWISFYKPYADFKETTLPDFKQGENAYIDKFEILDKMTQPPKRYTEASVVQELEKLQLGTKATRASIVETLYKRGYVEEKQIHVTELGMTVSSVLEKYSPAIMDDVLTRNIEMKLEMISEGGMKKEEIIQEGKDVLSEILTGFKEKEIEIGAELSVAIREAKEKASLLGPCNKCGKQLRLIIMRGGKAFVGCTGYPECHNTYPVPQMALIKPLGKMCEFCHAPMIKVIRRGKRPFDMCITVGCKSKENWGKHPYIKKNADGTTTTITPAAGTASATTDAKATASKPAEEKKEKPKEPPLEDEAPEEKEET